jgi:hypothetical protein
MQGRRRVKGGFFAAQRVTGSIAPASNIDQLAG